MQRLFPVVVLVVGMALPCRAQTDGRLPLVDAVLGRMQGIGTSRNLSLIDSALLVNARAGDRRTAYFLRRYRCEQLYYQGLFEESMIEAAKARRIAEDLRDSLLIASSLNQMAVLIEEQDDPTSAILMLREALRWYPARTTSAYPLTQPHRIHGNIGRCFADRGELDSARSAQERSLHLAKEARVPRGVALAYLELGRLRLRVDDPEGALELFDRVVAITSTSDVPDVCLEAMVARAEAYARMGKVDEVRRCFTAAHGFMDAHPAMAQRSKLACYDSEVRTMSAVGLYQGALGSARTWRTLDSAVRASAARTAQNTLATLHATETELLEESYRAALSAAEVHAEHRIRLLVLVAGGSALVLLALLAVILVGRWRQKDRLARLAFQRMEQERQIADLRIRQQVSADLHDDLGAGLSALKLHCELAEDLSADAGARNRGRTLSRIAGDLIAGMRHILWSLDHTGASVAMLSQYIIDRAQALSAERDKPLRIVQDGAWPEATPNAEVRHLCWVVVRAALNVLMADEGEGALELTVHWQDGLQLEVQRRGGSSMNERMALASAIADHQLSISRAEGTVRITTDGPLRMELRFPIAIPVPTGASVRHPGAGGVVAVAIAMFSMAQTLPAQIPGAYRDPVLDQLFSTEARGAAPADRLRAINAAIDALNERSDPRRACHLLLSRANQMYYQGLYDMGISDVNRSLELAKGLHDSLLIATTYNMIGLLYENLGNDAVTLPWFRLADRWLPADTRANYPVARKYHIDGNIAQCLINLGRSDSAEHHFNRSRAEAKADGNLRAVALADLGLARCRMAERDPVGAMVLLDSSMACAWRDGSHDVYVDALPIMARVRAQVEGTAAGLTTLDTAMQLLRSDSTITRSSMRNFYKQAYVLQEELGRYKAAVEAWGEWKRLDSAIHVTDDRAALATLKLMLDNDQRLVEERVERGRIQARLLLDREQRNALIIGTGTIAALMLGSVLLLAGRRKNKLRLSELELDRSKGRKELEELRSRQRLSEEMHQNIGAGLEALRMRSQLSMEMEPDVDHRQRLALITLRANELVGSLRQIIWALDSGRSSLQETVQYTSHYSSTYCSQNGITLSSEVTGPWPEFELSMEQRRNIFLAVKEALHNIVKHANAKKVELRMTMADELSVEIADNGHGMSSSASTGNGLRNMRKRIEAIGGDFTMEQRNGTIVRFTVPLVTAPDNLRSAAYATG